MNLCALTCALRTAVHHNKGFSENNVLNVLSTVVPILLMMLAYTFDTASLDNLNSQLNIARHAFSCAMRFEDLKTEWALLWVHFIWSGVLVAYFSVSASLKIADMLPSGMISPEEMSDAMKTTVNAVNAQRQRLFKVPPIKTTTTHIPSLPPPPPPPPPLLLPSLRYHP